MKILCLSLLMLLIGCSTPEPRSPEPADAGLPLSPQWRGFTSLFLEQEETLAQIDALLEKYSNSR